ncbi:hypothetical protein Tco_0737693 [Tanacetum coccineum]
MHKHQKKEEETTKDTKVEPDKDTPMVDVTNIVIPVNVDNEDDEITDEVFELRRRVKGKNVEETRISPIPSLTRSPRNISILVSSDTEKLQELTVTHPTPSSGSYAQKLTKTNHLLSLIKAKPNQFKRYKSFFFMNYRGLIWLLICTSQEKGSCHDSSDQLADNLHDVRWKRYPRCERENIAIWLALQMKFEKTQVPQTACRSYVVRTREQNDPHDAHPEGENSVKRQKTSEYEAYVSGESSSGQVNVEEPGDEHQYHIDQMKNFLQSDIVWESRKEILVSPHPRKITPLVQSCPEKIILSLHKFPAIVFNDDDIEERTSRWVNKCIKKFNPYARYGVENWKNPHAKIFYIRRQKEPGRPKEEIYSNSKIVQVIKTYWELGHEHKFITEIVARRANDCIVPDYANTRLLWSLSVFIRSSVIWERVHDFQLGIESYQQKINLTAPTITFPGIEEYDVFSIYGYVQKDLTNDEVEFLKFVLEKRLEVRLTYQDQMKIGDVSEWKDNLDQKGTPIIIDP